MKYLPPEIWRYIYEYDDTYKIKFNKVLQHLTNIFIRYNIYNNNYLFHNDLNYNINLQKHNIFYFATMKTKNNSIMYF